MKLECSTGRGLAIAMVAAAVALAGCARKPTEAECKGAVDNIRRLTGQVRAEGGIDPRTAIKSCRSRSNLETIGCQTRAKSLEDLAACEGEEGRQFLDEQAKREAELAAEAPKAEPPAPAATPPAATPTTAPAATPPATP